MTRPIARQALYQEVAARLRERIFRHEFSPGQWLDEQAIAQALGISRTPVREAIKVLAVEGLVTLAPGRGAFVTQISEKDLDDIFAILSLLEGHAARQAAERLTPEGAAALQAQHAALEAAFAAQDITAFFDANQAFHRLVQELADNPWLIDAIASLRQKVRLARHQSLFTRGRLQQSLTEHRALLAALLARDGPVAEKIMREHLMRGREAIRVGETQGTERPRIGEQTPSPSVA